MKIVVIGGTGLIGSKVVERLTALGHEAVAAAPNTNVNTLTGEGVADALAGAQVVVDVTNSPSFEESAVLEFFTTSTRNLLAAEEAAGVSHHVALSIVGIEGLPDNGYFRAKVAQEELIRKGLVPHTIVRATQFFEFVRGIADVAADDGGVVRVPPVLFQPMAAADVAQAVVDAALAEPVGGIIEVAGPDQFRFDELVREALQTWQDQRTVVTDARARYFGSELAERSLVPDDGKARLSGTHFRDWLAQNV
ncbi:SDR family oxidoreductase [Streptomyces justiciae]|uniref:SDR family oxidoreductase n=1 Tax=Streptomyces justiciae TaxID=2780140 RepID=A0ABU3M3P2_9ACTN|nr:SDR family oxidoreductase [Streptomyces justiciae]MDT7845651.1 SDR family oxidoreductase [Streptomyces justiciae]